MRLLPLITFRLVEAQVVCAVWGPLILSILWAQQGMQSEAHSGDTRFTSAWSRLTDWRGISLLRWAETFPWPQGTTHLAFTLRYKPHETSPRINLTIASAQFSEGRKKDECERKAKVVCFHGEVPSWEEECCAKPFSDCGFWVDQCLEEGGCAVTCYIRFFWPLSGVPAPLSTPHATRHLIEAAEKLPFAPGEYLSIIWRVAPTEEIIVDTIKLYLYDILIDTSAAQKMPLSMGVGLHFPRKESQRSSKPPLDKSSPSLYFLRKECQQKSNHAQDPFPHDGCMGKDNCLEWIPSPGKPYNYILGVGRPRPRLDRPHRVGKALYQSFPGKVQIKPEGTIYIEFPGEGPWTLRLWDMQGRLLETLTGLYRSFQLPYTLPEGVYRVEMISGSGQVYSRTVLLRNGF